MINMIKEYDGRGSKMDYEKHYNNLIEKRRKHVLESNCHKHHIIPRCIGGNDENDNLINLTYREHYIAHLLLAKIYKHTKYYYKMLCAVQRMGNSKLLKNNKCNSHLYNKMIIERNKIVGEKSKELYKGTSIYKNRITGEIRYLSKLSDEVKSGEYVGINKGIKNNKASHRLKSKIIAKDKENNVVIIDKALFETGEYVGINKGKTGLFSNLNTKIKEKFWFDRLMFFDLSNKHIKFQNKNIFEGDTIYKLYDIFYKQKDNKRIKWKDINRELELQNIFIKTIDKPFNKIVYYFRNKNWNPYVDEDFKHSLKQYNQILGEICDENQKTGC